MLFSTLGRSFDEELRGKKKRALRVWKRALGGSVWDGPSAADCTISTDLTLSGLTKVNVHQQKCAKAVAFGQRDDYSSAIKPPGWTQGLRVSRQYTIVYTKYTNWLYYKRCRNQSRNLCLYTEYLLIFKLHIYRMFILPIKAVIWIKKILCWWIHPK